MYTRPWAPGDLPRLQKAEPSFSARSMTSRFLTGTSRLPLPYVAALRRPQSRGRAWFGQVALAGGELVGMAECAWRPDSPRPAELAVLVADRWQRRGVGRLVVSGLLDEIEAVGMTHIEAVADATNAGCHALARAIDRERSGAGGWSIRSWVTGGHRYLELTRQAGQTGGPLPTSRRRLEASPGGWVRAGDVAATPAGLHIRAA